MLLQKYLPCSFSLVLHQWPPAGVIKADVGVKHLCLLTGIPALWYLLKQIISGDFLRVFLSK